ncbi:MAG: TerB family tellurite resistance protein [Pseudomonadota bacterium]
MRSEISRGKAGVEHMSIWGKILGAGVGFAIGGPIGALIGGAIGHVVDQAAGSAVIPYSGEGPEPQDQAQVAFTIGVIALSAKMAKADGVVSDEEVLAFRRLFKVEPKEQANVDRVFNLARQSTLGFDAYARQLGGLFAERKTILEDLLDALFQIAGADGTFHPAELKYLEAVAQEFQLSQTQYRRIHARYLEPDANDPYAILELDTDADAAAVKRAYRRLIRDNHPDRLIAQGLPQEFIKLANARMAEINTAYQTVMNDLKEPQ